MGRPDCTARDRGCRVRARGGTPYQRGSPRSDRSHRDGLSGQMPPRPARGPGRAAAREAPERLSRAAARPAGQTAAKGIDSPGRL